jgi:endonuclease YncB( thermonuclease family)
MRPRRDFRHKSWLRRIAESALALIVLILLAVAVQQVTGEAVSASPGAARAVDGDSLVINGERVRLWGIDAPELKQTCLADGATVPCGALAHGRLQDLIRGRRVDCAGIGKDRYDRLLAVCRTEGALEINATLVREGHAYDFGGYASEEAQARAARRGVWAGDNERPKAYRDRMRAGLEDEGGLAALLFHRVGRWLHALREGNDEAV